MTRPVRIAAAAAAAAFLALNVVAYRQADALTRFRPGQGRALELEELSPWGTLGVFLSGIRRPRKDPVALEPGRFARVEQRRIETRDGQILAAWFLPVPREKGVVVGLHGYSMDKAQLADEAKAVQALGWSVLLVDQRGHGDATGTTTTVGWHEAEDARAALASARASAQGRPVVLYGHSMGAAAVLGAVARRGARPDGVILELPFASLRDTVANRFHMLGLPGFPLADLLVFWAGVQRGAPWRGFSPLEDAAAVRAPALILAGGADRRAPPEEARAMRERIPGSALKVFDGLNHGALYRRAPRPWVEAVAPFLRALENDKIGP